MVLVSAPARERAQARERAKETARAVARWRAQGPVEVQGLEREPVLVLVSA